MGPGPTWDIAVFRGFVAGCTVERNPTLHPIDACCHAIAHLGHIPTSRAIIHSHRWQSEAQKHPKTLVQGRRAADVKLDALRRRMFRRVVGRPGLMTNIGGRMQGF